MNTHVFDRISGRRRRTLAILLPLLISEAMPRNALAGCKDGSESSCTLNGKTGTKTCQNGRWGPCEVEPEVKPPIHGKLKPRYMILTVVYSPPGRTGAASASAVSYGQASKTGTTTSMDKSFKLETKMTFEGGVGFLGLEGKASSSFAYSRNSTDSKSVDIKKSAGTEIALPGGPSDGIDHDRDQIYLWLNPEIDLTISDELTSWTLGAVGPSADIMFVYAGWLRNPAAMPAAVAGRLRRHGFTDADFAEVLASDPFAGGATAVDPNRFVQTVTTFPYEPPFSAGDPGSTFKFTLTSETATTKTSTVESSYSPGVTAEGGFDFHQFLFNKFKFEGSLTWTRKSSNASSSGGSESASVTIGSPSAAYTGPVVIAVYWDTLYNSFLFAPAPDPTVRVSGSVVDATGKPAAGREVVLMSGGVKRRTFTDAQGKYRFVGAPAGLRPEVTVSGILQSAPTRMAPIPQFDVRLPAGR